MTGGPSQGSGWTLLRTLQQQRLITKAWELVYHPILALFQVIELVEFAIQPSFD
jgi:hypothetical protein